MSSKITGNERITRVADGKQETIARRPDSLPSRTAGLAASVDHYG